MLECSTSVFLQMKDPDATHPRLFSEDSTTSTEEKVKIIMKTRGASSALAHPDLHLIAHERQQALHANPSYVIVLMIDFPLQQLSH